MARPDHHKEKEVNPNTPEAAMTTADGLAPQPSGGIGIPVGAANPE
jgi:hypothetical protein